MRSWVERALRRSLLRYQRIESRPARISVVLGTLLLLLASIHHSIHLSHHTLDFITNNNPIFSSQGWQDPSSTIHKKSKIQHYPRLSSHDLNEHPRQVQLEWKEVVTSTHSEVDHDNDNLRFKFHNLQLQNCTSRISNKIPEKYPLLASRYTMTYGAVARRGREMSPASVLDKGDCEHLADWQLDHRPTCNVIHEVTSTWDSPIYHREHEYSNMDTRSQLDPVDGEGNLIEMSRLLAGGAFRHVWVFREYDGTKRVLKTLRVDSRTKDFDLRAMDRHRRDAISMDQLTASPLIVDIFGYCTNSALFMYGEGGDLRKVFEKQPHISDHTLLEIAYNVSLSIAHAHHRDSRGRATMAHTDIKADQFLYQDGYYRLSDFNRVRFLSWHKRKDRYCGFKVAKNGGIWRSPEEFKYERETHKVDIFSLGNVLFFLLARGKK